VQYEDSWLYFHVCCARTIELPQPGRAEGATQTKPNVSSRDGQHDFDFFMGNWRVHHRRLKERLANNHEWVEFEGTCTGQKILGGLGNIGDCMLDLPGGAYRGVALRAYDPEKKQWSIWWLDGRSPPARCASRWPLRKRRWHVLCRRHIQGEANSRPLPLDRSDVEQTALGTGVLSRRGPDLGNDLGFHKDAMRARACHQVVELRQYTLEPGMRHVLIGLFEQEFIEKMDLIKRTELCRIPRRGSHDGYTTYRVLERVSGSVGSCVAASRLGLWRGKPT
jgi:hypothetical protein